MEKRANLNKVLSLCLAFCVIVAPLCLIEPVHADPLSYAVGQGFGLWAQALDDNAFQRQKAK